MERFGLDQIIGGCLAVITLGMPAVIALVKIRQLHVMINSRLTQLLEATAKAARTEGRLEGRLELQVEFEKLASNIVDEAAVKAKNILEEAAVKARKIIDNAAVNADTTNAS